jgi:hypothetical protein
VTRLANRAMAATVAAFAARMAIMEHLQRRTAGDADPATARARA